MAIGGFDDTCLCKGRISQKNNYDSTTNNRYQCNDVEEDGANILGVGMTLINHRKKSVCTLAIIGVMVYLVHDATVGDRTDEFSSVM